MKLLTIIGARPQFVKAGVVSREIKKIDSFQEVVVHTGQHFDKNMSDVFFDQLGIPVPNYQLNINGGPHGAMTGRMMESIEEIILREDPDRVMVYGDTNSTLAGALVAAKCNIPVAHVEAGLRSFNMAMPEEVNRILTDQLSDVLLCPTDAAVSNLNMEGFDRKPVDVHKVGDVMQDSAIMFSEYAVPPQSMGRERAGFILATLHRAENTDSPSRLRSIVEALNNLHREVAEVILPLHPRTKAALKSQGLDLQVSLIEPVGYFEMLWLLKSCDLVLTDSGGVQKEAYFFNKACVTMRDETEWVELIEVNANVLIGADGDKIKEACASNIGRLVRDESELYGGGKASANIVGVLSGGGGMKADPKRIWIINQYASLPSTGIGGRHRHLSRELARLGHRVTLIAARWTHGTRDTEAADDAPEQESFEGFRFIRISVGKYKHAHDKKRILNWLVFGVRLLQLQKKLGERPDVIIYSSPSLIGFLSAYYLSRKFKARLIFEVRDIWPLTLVQLGGFSPSHPFIVFLQKIEDLAYKKSHKVISNLRESHHHMVARGLDREKFAWVPNGVSIHEVSAVEPAPELMVSEFKKQPFSVVYAGTVGAANSLETLIMAASLLKDVTDIHFNIVGKGQKTHDLSVLINDLELTNVHLWPSVKKTQVQSVLSVMDVCYIGLTKDPLFRYGVSPNKLFDYMYSARPVVYSIDSGGYCPISEANAGIQIEPESPEEAAGAILALYNMSPEKREIMGRNARLAVLEKYEYSAIARTLESVVLDRAE